MHVRRKVNSSLWAPARRIVTTGPASSADGD